MKRLRTRHPAALALLLGGALAALVPVGSAVALDSPPSATAFVEIESAQLVAKGAGVDVTVTYLCPAGGSASLSTTVTQRSGPEVTSGSSSFVSLPCTGEPEQRVVRVTAGGGMRAFKSGTALVQASMFACGSGFCGSVSDQEEVSIRR
jgi:hypothetical protein